MRNTRIYSCVYVCVTLIIVKIFFSKLNDLLIKMFINVYLTLQLVLEEQQDYFWELVFYPLLKYSIIVPFIYSSI